MKVSSSDDIARHEDQAKQLEGDRFWESSGVSKRHMICDTKIIMQHKKFSISYSKALAVIHVGGTVLLLGDRGNGKTQCGVELIRSLCFNDLRSCRYIRCREIGMKLREAFGGKSNLTEMAAMEQFVRPYLLVIDECQERMESDFEVRSLTLIIDKRYGECKPSVLIANCSEKNFTSLLGPSIIDRAKEGGGAVLFDWPSFRGAR